MVGVKSVALKFSDAKKKKNKINAVLFMTFLFFSDHFMPCSWL